MLLAGLMLLLPKAMTDRADNFLAAVTSPFSGPTRNLSLGVVSTVEDTTARRKVPAKDYRRLVELYNQHEALLIQRTEELRQQRNFNAQLSGLVQNFGLGQALLIGARITGQSTAGQRQLLTLDRGSLEYVTPGQIALASLAPNQQDQTDQPMVVVGKIQQTGLRTSQLQLLNDPEFTLPVTIEPAWQREDRFQARGVLRGSALGEITVSMVSMNHPVRPGDVVVARSGLETLPIGVLVGTVASCSPDENKSMLWHIVVRPATELHELREVVIVNTVNADKH